MKIENIISHYWLNHICGVSIYKLLRDNHEVDLIRDSLFITRIL